tara:strand:- start:266 stop:655 length:390 start_codon:yes stop_codon:yes gene_type:complete
MALGGFSHGFSNGFQVFDLEIITTSLPDGNENLFYNQLVLSNAPNAVTWSLTSGTLPVGISLNPTGILSGNGTAGTELFELQVVKDTYTKVQDYSLTITPSGFSPGGAAGGVRVRRNINLFRNFNLIRR